MILNVYNMHKLAIHGSVPIRQNPLIKSIDMTHQLQFENLVKQIISCKYVLPIASNSAALQTILSCLNLKYDDEIIISPLSDIWIINSIISLGMIPKFCDIDVDTYNIDTNLLYSLITSKTRVIITNDYGGHTCEYDKIIEIKNQYNLILIQDATQSIGGYYNYKKTGTYSDITLISTNECGLILTNNYRLYDNCKIFINGGIYGDKLLDIGHNYQTMNYPIKYFESLMDIIKKRKEIYFLIDKEIYKFSDIAEPIFCKTDSTYYCYIIKLYTENLKCTRDDIFEAIKCEGIQVIEKCVTNHLQTLYTEYISGICEKCPIAQDIAKRSIIIPISINYSLIDINDIIKSIKKVLSYYKK